VKRLRLAFADSPGGPWKDTTEPFSGDWVEGPSAVKIGEPLARQLQEAQHP
jgi:hypothetical protein